MRAPITKRGEELLRKELEDLKAQRPNIAKLIGESRELGDLKENGEYHANREKQGMIEARIEDIERKLSQMVLIDPAAVPKNGKIAFGVYVELKNLKDNKVMKVQIVGEDEALMSEDKISIFSPLSRALIGKESGDNIEIETTKSNIMKYEVISVKYEK